MESATSHHAGNADRVRGLYEAWNRRDWAAVALVLSREIEWFHATRHELVQGVDAVVDLLKAAAVAFPDAKVEIHSIHEAGDFVIVEWFASRAGHKSEVPSVVSEVQQFRDGR